MLGASLGMWFTSQRAGIFNCAAVKTSKRTKWRLNINFYRRTKILVISSLHDRIVNS
jgi:hypothetical protein